MVGIGCLIPRQSLLAGQAVVRSPHSYKSREAKVYSDSKDRRSDGSLQQGLIARTITHILPVFTLTHTIIYVMEPPKPLNQNYTVVHAVMDDKYF